MRPPPPHHRSPKGGGPAHRGGLHRHHHPARQQQQPQQPQQSGAGGHQQAAVASTAAAGAAEFPECVTAVLREISDYVAALGKSGAASLGAQQNKGWNRVKAKELQARLDADLFCLGAGQCRLNPLQRLKLLGIVCTYFQKEVANETDPNLRYMHFDTIFCGREGEAHLHDARIQFLVKLCSMAVQFPCYGLFEHVALWLGRVKSDDLKRSYVEMIVAELVDGFILAPARLNMHEFLVPLWAHSPDFCVQLVVFAVRADSLGPALAALVGEWLADEERCAHFVRILAASPHLAQPFSAQKFALLLRYNCSNGVEDEVHDRFSYTLLQIAAVWGTLFRRTQSVGADSPTADSLKSAFHAHSQVCPFCDGVQQQQQSISTTRAHNMRSYFS